MNKLATHVDMTDLVALHGVGVGVHREVGGCLDAYRYRVGKAPTAPRCGGVCGLWLVENCAGRNRNNFFS